MFSVIVTSYNQSRTLELLLHSLSRQTLKDFECVIADDGSSDGTKEICEKWAKLPGSFAIRFVTQPDEGYRKSKILNQAIQQCKGDYLVFLDGDVIIEKHFVEDHFRLRKPRSFVCGRRVELGPEVSQEIKPGWIYGNTFDSPFLTGRLFLSALKKDTQNFKRCVRVTSPFLRDWLGYKGPTDLLGSNFSIWKADLESVNGFNEAMEAYWGEDGDLFIRLRNSGIATINAKGMCVQYHVFHPRREPNPEHLRNYEKLLENREYKWAEKGLRST
jgi:glycosyltransferase involved in cell wall biosynthesis